MSEHRALRTMGITLIGVVLSVAATVGFGMSGPWWLRAASAVATAVVLITLVKLATTAGSRGVVARAADWVTGEGEEDRTGP